MNTLDKDFAAGLLDNCDPPCLSLYQPTHRHHPGNKQDPIRFGNLVKALEQSLRQGYAKAEIEPLLEPLRTVANDRDFWDHTLDGLAILRASTVFRVYRLQRAVPELAIVADSFHTKPLMRILQSADRYQVLGLSRQEFRLFEGNRDVLDEVEPAPEIPRTMDKALGVGLTEPHQASVPYGGVGGKSSPVRRGRDGRQAAIDIDTERFFRAVDRGVLEQHSRPSGLPLILAALPEHHHLFHEISDNPYLIDDSIDVHPDSLSSIDELRRRAWKVVEPHYLARLSSLAEEFGGARSNGLGDDDLAQVVKAVVGGRVGTLLIEAGREIPGRLDAATGKIEFDDLAHPEVDDVLDDLGTLVLKMGGQVVVVPAERVPTKTGVAAIYRY